MAPRRNRAASLSSLETLCTGSTSRRKKAWNGRRNKTRPLIYDWTGCPDGVDTNIQLSRELNTTLAQLCDGEALLSYRTATRMG
eukprot:133267-Prorocentrum_lima.AAC.1